MALIIDASVAVKWFVNENGSSDARELTQGAALYAPEFALIELVHILWGFVRRDRFKKTDLDISLQQARYLFTHLETQNALFPEAGRLAWSLAHPIYDCLSIAMASALKMPLITADEKQFTAARKCRGAARML